MESREIIVLSCLCMYFVLAYFISKIMPQGRRISADDTIAGGTVIAEKIYMGRYLSGLSNKIPEAPFVFCRVTHTDFIFTQGTQGREIGRIPRDSISRVVIMSGAQIMQYVNKKRIRLISGRKAETESGTHSLMLEWGDAMGLNHDAIFEFSESMSRTQATSALDSLQKFIKPVFYKAAN